MAICAYNLKNLQVQFQITKGSIFITQTRIINRYGILVVNRVLELQNLELLDSLRFSAFHFSVEN